jgi:group I intron endonuclease
MSTNSSIIPIKTYSNAQLQKEEILKENKGKSGIYRWFNKVNGRSYVGSAANLSIRLNLHYLGDRSNIILQQAFIKKKSRFGLTNFSLEILEYCESNKDILLEREQYDLRI